MNDKNETTREEAWDHYCLPPKGGLLSLKPNWIGKALPLSAMSLSTRLYATNITTPPPNINGDAAVGYVLVPFFLVTVIGIAVAVVSPLYLCQLSTQATLIKRGSPLSHTSCAFALFVSDHVYSPETKVHPFSCYTATYLQIMTMYCWCFQMQLNDVFVLQNRPAPSPAEHRPCVHKFWISSNRDLKRLHVSQLVCYHSLIWHKLDLIESLLHSQ